MTALILFLYNLLLEIVYFLSLPLLLPVLWYKNYLSALAGRWPDSDGGVMVHAASVGEVNAVKPLILALKERYPNTKLVITTTTVTGLKTARNLGFPARLAALDVAHLRRRQLKQTRPRLILIVETEIWPNLLDQARRQKIAVAFVNARISEKSLRRYRKARGLIRYLERPVVGVFTQSEQDAGQFRRLFDVPVRYAGNLKYAVLLPQYDAAALRREWGYSEDDFIVCMGSSRPGEEAMLQAALPGLKEKIPGLKLIIAPRHPKRRAEVQKLFQGERLWSELKSKPGPAKEILLVDEIGHLNECYAICDLAIVGGSFYDFGGHNPLEPAVYGKPTVMGEHHKSCEESVTRLARNEAILISYPDLLSKDLISLYRDPARRARMGQRAAEPLKSMGNSLDQHLEGLKQWLD